jgi:hypothetical protein
MLKWLLGYRFSDVEPIRDIRHLGRRPILLIHGMADSMVDPEDSEMLFDAAQGPKELWQVEGTEHCGAYFADREYYVNRTVAFFDRALGAESVRWAAFEEIELKEQEQRNNHHKQQNHEHQRQPRSGVPGIRLIGPLRLHADRSSSPDD